MKKSALNRDLCLTLNRGDVEAAKKLIAQGADVNATSRATADSTLLWLTVKAAGQEISKNFRELGAGLAELLPNVPQRNHAAEREKHLRILRLLIEAKADVNKPSHGGTPLRIAVCGQDLEVVKLLLANGANPNAETFSILSNLTRKTQPGYQNTVLHEAVEKGSLPIAEALLAAGADPNRTDHEGKTPLAIAQEKGFTALVTLLQGRTTVQSLQPSEAQSSDDIWRAASEGRLADLQKLIANGANVNARMSDRSTPLLLAASAGQTEVVKFLVLLKANVEAAERGGHTPFTIAVVGGHVELADFLLRHGADPNRRVEPFDMTALMFVAGQKLLKAVEFLLAAGADARLCDARGQNALHHAVSGAVVHKVVDIGPAEGLPEGAPEDALPIIERLLASGADSNTRDKSGKTPLNYARELRLTQIATVLEKPRATA